MSKMHQNISEEFSQRGNLKNTQLHITRTAQTQQQLSRNQNTQPDRCKKVNSDADRSQLLSQLQTAPINTKVHLKAKMKKLLNSYLLNVRFILLASECSRRAVWPQAAFISFHSTWQIRWKKTGTKILQIPKHCLPAGFLWGSLLRLAKPTSNRFWVHWFLIHF